MSTKMQAPKYKVNGKTYETLQAAKKAQKQAKAGLPEDAVMTIYRAEKDNMGGVMWVPYR